MVSRDAKPPLFFGMAARHFCAFVRLKLPQKTSLKLYKKIM